MKFIIKRVPGLTNPNEGGFSACVTLRFLRAGLHFLKAVPIQTTIAFVLSIIHTIRLLIKNLSEV